MLLVLCLKAHKLNMKCKMCRERRKHKERKEYWARKERWGRKERRPRRKHKERRMLKAFLNKQRLAEQVPVMVLNLQSLPRAKLWVRRLKQI